MVLGKRSCHQGNTKRGSQTDHKGARGGAGSIARGFRGQSSASGKLRSPRRKRKSPSSKTSTSGARSERAFRRGNRRFPQTWPVERGQAGSGKEAAIKEHEERLATITRRSTRRRWQRCADSESKAAQAEMALAEKLKLKIAELKNEARARARRERSGAGTGCSADGRRARRAGSGKRSCSTRNTKRGSQPSQRRTRWRWQRCARMPERKGAELKAALVGNEAKIAELEERAQTCAWGKRESAGTGVCEDCR